MAVLYFAKISVNNGIYEIYSDKEKLQKVLNILYENMTKVSVELDDELDDELGEISEFINNYKYILTIEKKDDTNQIILGRVTRRTYINLGDFDEDDETYEEKRSKNDRQISFYFDIKNEVVVYNSKSYFGYKKFIKAFRKIINTCYPGEETFEVELIKNYSDALEDIKGFKKIKSMTTVFIPPNANSEEFQILFGKKAKENKDNNIVKEKNTLIADEKGLPINGEIVKRGLYLGILGYGTYEAEGIGKDDYPYSINSEDDHPLKEYIEDSVSGDLDYLREFAKDKIEFLKRYRKILFKKFISERKKNE